MKDLCLENWDTLFNKVLNENQRQLKKWGVQDRTPEQWLMFATEELGETAKAIAEHKWRGGSADDVIEEAIQTTTLCLKIAEMYMAEGGCLSQWVFIPDWRAK